MNDLAKTLENQNQQNEHQIIVQCDQHKTSKDGADGVKPQ